MSRTIVVSNRVSVPRPGKSASAGGLEVAIREALHDRPVIWFGWSGKISDKDTTPRHSHHNGIEYVVSDLTPTEHAEFYKGFANSVLWPVLHYRLDLAEFNNRDWSGYLGVNQRLADQLFALLQPDDVIWVHDYHFIPFAKALRELGCRNRIGFFLHVPLPPPEILTAMPNYQHLLPTFAAYDLIGFQTDNCAANFARFLAQEYGLPNHVPITSLSGPPSVRIGTFPVGIAVEDFRRQAEQSIGSPYVRRVCDSLGGALIIGVDRLDYSKGLALRLQAYEHFLDSYPDWEGKTTYLQITPKSRSQIRQYADMQQSLERAAGRISGAYGNAHWTPIRYINRAHSRKELAGLYRAARVGLVTPLRDGMNLVAKEYVAAQNPEDPGVLVLSKFAGAAVEMKSALIVNPYDREAVALAIAKALEMPIAERRQRHAALYEALTRNDIAGWGTRFLAALESAKRPAAERTPFAWTARDSLSVSPLPDSTIKLRPTRPGPAAKETPAVAGQAIIDPTCLN